MLCNTDKAHNAELEYLDMLKQAYRGWCDYRCTFL